MLILSKHLVSKKNVPFHVASAANVSGIYEGLEAFPNKNVGLSGTVVGQTETLILTPPASRAAHGKSSSLFLAWLPQ